MSRIWAAAALAALLAGPAAAIWPFGESEEARSAALATRVAESLREPNRAIAQAQDAVERDDTEEAIRQFRRAQALIEEIEAREDTSGSAWAPMRIKKFHCLSMLDALALERAEVQDVRQAVTDTTELERRLAEERAQLNRAEEEKAAKERLYEPPKPPTLADQLPPARRDLAAAEAARDAAEKRLLATRLRVQEAEKAQTAAAQAEASARRAFQEAAQALSSARARAQGGGLFAAATVPEAERGEASAEARAKAAAAALRRADEALDAAQAHLRADEAAAAQARARADEAGLAVETIEKALAQEQAEAAARERARREAEEAERKRREAETLLLRQRQAEAEERAREAARRRAQADAAAKAEAERDARAAEEAYAACRGMWEAKRIDLLESALAQNAVKWPEHHGFMLLLARLRLLQGRPDDALEIVGSIPQGSEAGFEAQLVGAGAFLTKNRPEEAMRVLEAAMKRRPKDPRPYFNMAVAFMRMPVADPDRKIAAEFYVKSVELGGKRSADVERRLNME